MLRRILLTVCVALSVSLGLPAADLSGRWHFVFDTEAGIREADMELEVTGQQVLGRIMGLDSAESAPEVKGTYAEGRLALEFEYYSPDAGYKSMVKIKGALEGDKITGEWVFDQHSGTFTATRVKAQ